jgi:hypothetical protein
MGIHLAGVRRWIDYLLTNTPAKTDASLNALMAAHALCGHKTQKDFRDCKLRATRRRHNFRT